MCNGRWTGCWSVPPECGMRRLAEGLSTLPGRVMDSLTQTLLNTGSELAAASVYD